MKMDDQASVAAESKSPTFRRAPVIAALSVLMLLLCACTTVDVNEYALQPANDVAGLSIFGSARCPKRDLGPMPALARAESATDREALAIVPLTKAIYPYDHERSLLPESLQATPVVKTIFRVAKLTAAAAVYERYQAVNAAVLHAAEQARSSDSALSESQRTALAVESYQAAYLKRLEREQSPGGLGEKDFRNFADEFSEQMLRHTASATTPANVTSAAEDAFWKRVHKYYSAYAAGKFVDYFGTQYAKPSLSRTVTDGELANLVGVFLEIVFDAAAKTPVWTQEDSQTGQLQKGSATVHFLIDVSKEGWKKGMIIANDVAIPSGTTLADIAKGGKSVTLSAAATKTAAAAKLTVAPTAPAQRTYWPGDSTNEPSALMIWSRKPRPMALKSSSVDCGMTVRKAKAIDTAAQAFAGAASDSAGAAVGTIGGVGISLGLFGKVSIGDNRAVTSLVQAVVSELVKRLTVQTMYPVLESVRFGGKLSSYQMTALFASPNHGKTPLHHTWLP